MCPQPPGTWSGAVLGLWWEHNPKPLCDGGPPWGTLSGFVYRIPGAPQRHPPAGLAPGLRLNSGQHSLSWAGPALWLPSKEHIPTSLAPQRKLLRLSRETFVPSAHGQPLHRPSATQGQGPASRRGCPVPVGGVQYESVSVAEKISSKDNGPPRNQGDVLLPH